MPIIEVKAFERRFQDPEQSKLLIERLTDALVSVFGEAVILPMKAPTRRL